MKKYLGLFDYKESDTFRPTIESRIHLNYPTSKTICANGIPAIIEGGGEYEDYNQCNEEVNMGNDIKVIGNYSPSGHNASRIVDSNGIAPTVMENHGTVTATIFKKDNILKGGKQLSETIEKNIDKFKEGKILNMDLYNRSVNEEISQTLTEPNHNSQRLFDGLRIRKLTPKECWRLMGFDDEDFEKAEKVNSNTQLYKQAGNSIVVNVLEKILNNLIDKDESIKILELFGGIGACSKALERLGIEYEITDYVEIDKYAVKSFNAIHNSNFEPQDICEWNKDMSVDLIMHGSPCQDFSLAGKQAGGDEGSGTRSSLMYETIRIVEKLKPKYVIWENVKNVISKKHIHNFNNYIERMCELGYTSYYQVLNAKDYGIPQNRERVFTISIRKDIDKDFKFPPKEELKLKLKDMLEDNVDEKYYLSDKMIKYISVNGTGNFRNPDSKINLDVARPLTTDQNKRAGTTNYLSSDLPDNYNLNQVGQLYGTEKEQNPQDGRIYDSEGLMPSMMSGGNKIPKILIKNATKQGYLEAEEGDGIDISSRMEYHRGNVQPQSIQTITTSGGNDRGVCVGTYQYSKSDKFMQGKDRLQLGKEISDTLQTQPKEGVVLREEYDFSDLD